MIGRFLTAMALLALLAAAPAAAQTSSLSVSPTSITVRGGGVGVLTLRAGGSEMTHGQIRVMRMEISGGREILSPTSEVVASPPAMKLRPGQEMTVRLVRKARGAVRGRQCYRVLVDQLPLRRPEAGTVGLVIRQSIPLCFVAG